MMNNLTGNWEPLGKKAKVFVTREHSFNTDTILLANFAAPRHKDNVADFGTGCGTIPLIWAARYEPKSITAVELQDRAYTQAKMSIDECGFDINLVQGDVNNYRELFPHQDLDLISCNPPYKADGTGIKNDNKNMTIARHEDNLSLEQLAAAAKFALKFGGRLCICQRPERLSDAMNIFREYQLESKKLRLVQTRKDKAPFIFLLECKRGAKPGLEIMPTLILEENGETTPEMLEIYGDYKTN
ncbi:MAG: methyltransferase [Clostridia bacterium]|nr:methyltransferase [Clostridia bacterium]